MKVNRFFWSILFCVAITFCVISWNISILDIYKLSNHVIVNNLNEYYQDNVEHSQVLLSNGREISNSTLTSIPKKVYLGGDVLGFSYYGDGVLVVSNKGLGYSIDELKSGDIIKSINGIPIKRIETISKVLSNTAGEEVAVKIVREGKECERRLKPAYDVLSKKYKLGIWARESLSGIGTLTFIDPENGEFGALGHPILEPNTKALLEVDVGEVHRCSVLGVKPACRGIPGEIRGIFIQSKNNLGVISKNCDFGLFGKLNLNDDKFKDKELIEVGGRLSAKPGKAQIYSCIDGKTIRAYDIEIIKTNYQNSTNTKSLVFKVTDKRLIEITGGIVQGMSGSPIVQDGKLIGAVTHVFVNDATKGFGIYIDSMLAN